MSRGRMDGLVSPSHSAPGTADDLSAIFAIAGLPQLGGPQFFAPNSITNLISSALHSSAHSFTGCAQRDRFLHLRDLRIKVQSQWRGRSS
jgi:hypothetical protein